jgi:hypothetical protein
VLPLSLTREQTPAWARAPGRLYTTNGISANWQRLIKKALAKGVITERYSYHDIRPKCVSDSEEEILEDGILGQGMRICGPPATPCGRAFATVCSHRATDSNMSNPLGVLSGKCRMVLRTALERNAAMPTLIRKAILPLHRWAGLTLGLLMAWLALTGAAMVFAPQLRSMVDHQLQVVPACTQSLPLDALIDRARAAHIGGTLRLM